MRERWSAFDLIEGYHLASAVRVLHDEKALQLLRRPQTSEQLAAKLGLDSVMLRAVLQYVASRTEILRQRGSTFQTTELYDVESRFSIDQYLGAYGPNLNRLSLLLRDPDGAAGTVDRVRHAEAFSRLGNAGSRLLSDVILQLEFTRLLDLGCGAGALLMTLAQRDSGFIGWGVDANPAMCAAARKRIRRAGLHGRVGIFEGDCRNLDAAVAADIREGVEAISAASLLNEFFGRDAISAEAWLRQLRELFPERALVVSDYYGRLGLNDDPAPRRTLLHDFVQVISGQGVPPCDRAGWTEIYEAAGCELIHGFENKDATFFIHVLRL